MSICLLIFISILNMIGISPRFMFKSLYNIRIAEHHIWDVYKSDIIV